ncbi:MAG: hypothetical protein ACOZB0_03760 [Pseudomonadota bacterium]
MSMPQGASSSSHFIKGLVFSPIMFAFVIGSLPILIPVLVLRCLAGGGEDC